ncbi:MAG: putative membrane protein [Candidatus Methanohalarchaeum thermophilum]|uniref:Membrane protein n=1 Tax=Methanohalarchaeum thermophilum TaxID=1903181 RepID=A0A1Q6DT78_METT1|nr:MAG: putative membrane protein [Candidatus Methanohalarchaeum thermophilum]
MFFLPLALPLLLIFFVIPFLMAYLVLSVGSILGFSPFMTLLIYMLILIGSAVNIPIFKLEKKETVAMPERDVFGFKFPDQLFRESKYITVSLNLGGAIIPTLLSFYLLLTIPIEEIYATMVATLIVVFVSKKGARLVEGAGISMPMIIPPLTAVLASMFSLILFNLPFINLAKISFFSGVLGVLIGADILNLNKIKKLRVSMISIGGAGTFDGIFLTGVFSVIFSALFI